MRARSYLLFLALSLMISGCNENYVRYSDFLIKPQAHIVKSKIIVDLGATTASAAWIKPEIRRDGEDIYISGKLFFHQELPTSITIDLSSKNSKLYWLDPDGTKTRINMKEERPSM